MSVPGADSGSRRAAPRPSEASPGPLVSVVMPVFNGEQHLNESIESILDQSFTDFEFIMVDDGSTDATPGIIAHYSGADSRIRAVRQDNAGVVASLNRGCSLARGRYIARMDADDVSLPVRLERQVGFLERHAGVAILGTGFRHLLGGNPGVDQAMPPTRELIRWDLCFRNCICHPSVMMRREPLAQLGFYSARFSHCEDYDLWVRAIERVEIANLAEVLLLYRISERGVSKTHTDIQGRVHLGLMQVMIERLLERPVSPEQVAALRCIETHAWQHALDGIEAAERLLAELHREFAARATLSARERKWLASDVRLKRAILLADAVGLNPRVLVSHPSWVWKGISWRRTRRVLGGAALRAQRALRVRMRAADDRLFSGFGHRRLYGPPLRALRALRRISPGRGVHRRGDDSGTPRARARGGARRERVVIWGHPLHSHTHSYIHFGFARAFEHLGFEVLWLDGAAARRERIDASIFLTEGQVDRHIPLLRSAKYVLHNCDSARYQAAGLSFLNLQAYTDESLDAAQASARQLDRLGPCEWYDRAGRVLHQPWATDLLPDEIARIEPVMPSTARERCCYWVGTIGAGCFGNTEEIGRFARACRVNGIRFVEAPKHATREENVAYVRRSHLAPAIQGKWQLDHGYVPCRIFKNISYGHLGLTNSKTVHALFEGEITYRSDAYELLADGRRDLEAIPFERRRRVMQLVAERHTYLNRIENILKLL